MPDKGFIKNTKLLDENSRIDNLIDLTNEIERFSIKLDNIEYSSLIGFIGKFGSGKSNFLNQIKNKYVSNSKWIDFDAWKYPERVNLWENFILEFARQIDTKTFDKTIKQVDGTVDDDKKTLINTIGDIPGLGAVKNFNYFIKTTPAKRNFEVEILLKELVKQITADNIYIIIEDIDRSGDNGIFFLETLNHFLKNNEIEKRIIAIVPIGEENYLKEDVKLSYLKSLDYIHSYSLRDIKLENFISMLFMEDIYDRFRKGQIISFLEGIFKEFTEQMTMRKLKHILRNANSNYIALKAKQGEGVDWRLSILFETAKYIKHDSGNLYIDIWKKSKGIGENESIFSGLIDCILADNPETHLSLSDSVYNSENRPKTLSINLPIKIINYDNSSEHKNAILLNKYHDSNKNCLGIRNDYLD